MACFRSIVHDVDAAVRFYTGTLGFTLVDQYGPAMAIVRRDDTELWLAGPPASASRPMPDGAQPVPGGWGRIVLMVDDIERVVADLRAAGTTIRSEIIAGPGGRQVLCLDPSGNPVELFEAMPRRS